MIDVGIKLPEIGRIKIGAWREVPSKKNPGTMTKIPYGWGCFGITTTEKNPRDLDNFFPDEAMTRLVAHPNEKDPLKPKRIGPVYLPLDSIEGNLYTVWANYRSSNADCIGDGRIAHRSNPDMAGTMRDEIECDPSSCPYALEDKCRPSGVLSVLFPKAPTFGGVWTFRTKSMNSVRTLQSQMILYWSQTESILGVGRLSGIPLWLVHHTKRCTLRDGRVKTVPFVSLEFDGPYDIFVATVKQLGVRQVTGSAISASRKTEQALIARAAQLANDPEEFVTDSEMDEAAAGSDTPPTDGLTPRPEVPAAISAPATDNSAPPPPSSSITEPRDGSEGILLHKNTPAAKAAAAAATQPAAAPAAPAPAPAPAPAAAPAPAPAADEKLDTTPISPNAMKNQLATVSIEAGNELIQLLNKQIAVKGRAYVSDRMMTLANVNLETLYAINEIDCKMVIDRLKGIVRSPAAAPAISPGPTSTPAKAPAAPAPETPKKSRKPKQPKEPKEQVVQNGLFDPPQAPVAAPAAPAAPVAPPAPPAAAPAPAASTTPPAAPAAPLDDPALRADLVTAIINHGTFLACRRSPGQRVGPDEGMVVIRDNAKPMFNRSAFERGDLNALSMPELMRLEGALNMAEIDAKESEKVKAAQPPAPASDKGGSLFDL